MGASPLQAESVWYFEDIDIARLELVCHLTQDIEVNDEGMDVAFSLLDQLYGLRAHMRKLTHAIAQQPPEVQARYYGNHKAIGGNGKAVEHIVA